MIYPYKGIVFAIKKKWSPDVCCNVDELWKQYAYKNRSKDMYHGFIYTTFRVGKADVWVPVAGRNGKLRYS